MKASRGPGKTATLSWLAWNYLVTRPHPKIAATSISGDNLRDGLWTEMAKWQQKSEFLSKKFIWQKERISSKESPKTWWMSARQWSKSATPETVGNTLAGLHADYILFLLDESGGMPEAIMASAEAALSSCKEGHIVQAGNPTHREGPLFNACLGDERKLWYIVEISADPDNPKRTPRVTKQWAQEQIDKWGRENPWVLVNVFGQFPPASLNALLSQDEVDSAVGRYYKEPDYKRFARILGVDVSRYGDDSSIVFPRQGLVAFPPAQYRNINGTEGAELVARKWDEWQADACFVDSTGGFGSSWIDNLYRLGKSPIGIAFNGKSSSDKYFNKRTEMAMELTKWIKEGGSIPNIKELKDALTLTTYTFKGDRLMLEPKEDVKEKMKGISPDHMDALMLTFAMPVEASERLPFVYTNKHQIDYNPFDRANVTGQPNIQYDYQYNPRG